MSGTKVIPSDSPKCPQCGTPLPAGALAGLCPACLLKQGAADETATGGQSPPFLPPPVAELAAKFPQLEILELIGKGGMGAVYKARQKELDRIVALKILPPGIGQDAAFAGRFAREAKALAKLNHPGIVTLYEFGQTNGLFFFLMEFVDGVNLRQLLHAGRIAPREALAIVPQICDALQYAHDQGIVHRDIKPENILLDRRGRVKVADFGLAKLVGEAGRAGSPLPAYGPQTEDGAHGVTRPTDALTAAGKVMGTPNYMAPEQKEHPDAVDHRADIYALGVVFYQMLTGELPGKSIEPPSSRMRGMVVDVRLDEVVLRALEKKPELRYQQASVLKTQVETIASTTVPTDKRLRPFSITNATPFSKFIFWCAWPIFGGYFFLLLNDHFNGTNQNLWHYFSYVFLSFAAICGVDTVLRIRRSLKAKTPTAMHELKVMRRTMLISGALALAITVYFVALPGCRKTQALRSDKSFEIGQAWFPEGDSIKITSVDRSTNRMIVKGRYNLVSHDQAELALHITTSTDIRVPEDAKNRMQISKGRGDFELVHSHLFPGLPHVSMYADSRSFAALYFGTKAEALEESKAGWITKASALAKTGIFTFGPVMERVVEEPVAPDFKWFDLDTGQSISSAAVPKDVEDSVFEEWMRKSGVDVAGSLSIRGKLGLVARAGGFIGLPVQAALWDSGSAQTVVAWLSQVRTNGDDINVLPADGGLPATFMFQTREGGRGILQIIGSNDSPRGVKIRYKLVRKPPTIFQLGAEQECVLPELTVSGTNLYFNFRSNRWITCTRPDFGSPAYYEWLRENGADISADLRIAGSTNLPQAVGCFMAIVFPGPEVWNNTLAWEDSSSDAILTNSALAAAKCDGEYYLGNDRTVYYFRTRDDVWGILQITGLTQNPRGVKIRYKLVQPATVSPVTMSQAEAPSAELEFRLVAAEGDISTPADQLADPNDRTGQTRLRIQQEVLLDSAAVASASLQSDSSGEKNISIVLKNDAAQKFSDITAANIGRRLAIVWRGRVLSAPVIRDRITGPAISVTGKMSDAECQVLLDLLNFKPASSANTRGPTAFPSANAAGTDAALPAILVWLSLMDNGQYAESWQQASDGFRALVTQADWVDKGESIRRPLGKLLYRKLEKTEPNGPYFVAKFDSSFEAFRAASETATFALETNGQWRAAGYLIRPRVTTNSAAVEPAQSWLREIDNGGYAQSWTEAAPYFQSAITSEKWVESMQAFRQPLGSLVSRKVIAAQEMSSLPGAPDGRYIVMQFETSFANKQSAVETVTFMLEKDGHWRAAGYYIK